MKLQDRREGVPIANRRMFSKAIVHSGRFISMPSSSQLLYFHLGMVADDDGYVEALPLMRMVNANEQDLRVLSENNLVKVFDDLVLIILDWKENNQIRVDRYNQSRFSSIYPIDMATNGLPNGNQRLPQVRLGKVRLGKASLEREDTPLTQKPFSSKKDITENILKDISEQYEVPVEFVMDCWDSAGNWLDAKGKVQKNYKAFLCNWVKREKANYILKAKSSNFKRGGVYDARE